MKAMILAAGLGTRLRPLTNNKPKALIEIHGRPMLEWLILRLKEQAFNDLIINTHHFADQIQAFLKTKNNFDIHIEISHESELLDTGGGIKKAAWFFDDDKPFLVHNVDVLTDLDYRQMMVQHIRQKALVTLAVRDRKTSRYFLFDRQNNLCGWQSIQSNERRIVRNEGQAFYRRSFMGIHIVSPYIFQYMKNENAFSIIETYLQVAANQTIKSFAADDFRWLDLGRKENLEEAELQFQDIFNSYE